jgi:hypothetical protein
VGRLYPFAITCGKLTPMINEACRTRNVRLSTPQPPPPDTSHVPRYSNLTVLECLYSEDLRYRAVLVRDSSAYLRVRYEMWDLSEWPNSGFAFWGQVGQGTTITDTIDNARLLARERLLELGALEAK